MFKRRQFQNENGMTLVEILASITILSIILVTIIGFFTQAARYTARNEKKTVAISVAQGTMNYIQEENFDNIKNYFSTAASPLFSLKVEEIADESYKIVEPTNLILDSPDLAGTILNKTIINNLSFKNNIEIIIVNYPNLIEETQINTLKSKTHLSDKNFTFLKDTLKQKIGKLKNEQYLFHTYVVVTWDDTARPIILEGTIKHESLR